MFEMIKEQLKIYEKFKMIEHSEERSRKFTQLQINPFKQPRFDLYHSNGVIWINDLEIDHTYSNWPSDRDVFILFIILFLCIYFYFYFILFYFILFYLLIFISFIYLFYFLFIFIFYYSLFSIDISFINNLN